MVRLTILSSRQRACIPHTMTSQRLVCSYLQWGQQQRSIALQPDQTHYYYQTSYLMSVCMSVCMYVYTCMSPEKIVLFYCSNVYYKSIRFYLATLALINKLNKPSLIYIFQNLQVCHDLMVSFCVIHF